MSFTGRESSRHRFTGLDEGYVKGLYHFMGCSVVAAIGFGVLCVSDEGAFNRACCHLRDWFVLYEYECPGSDFS